MVTRISHSPEDTERIASELAQRVTAGTVIGLDGELGAGKTLFVRAFGRALGVTDRIKSPTFALVHQYLSGRTPLYHLDLYRLESDAQIITAELHDYFESDGITLVEWMNRWHGPRPTRMVQVTIQIMNDSSRRIEIDDYVGA